MIEDKPMGKLKEHMLKLEEQQRSIKIQGNYYPSKVETNEWEIVLPLGYCKDDITDVAIKWGHMMWITMTDGTEHYVESEGYIVETDSSDDSDAYKWADLIKWGDVDNAL